MQGNFRVAVITPVYNAPDGIDLTIRSLQSQTLDHQHYVVDNGSTDRTRDVVQSRDSGCVLLRETDVQSSYAARNTGVRNADADVLAFVDADMAVADDWLDRALSEFR